MSEPKLIKVWVISSKDSTGYFAETPDSFINDFQNMDEGEEFTIKVRFMTKKQIETAHEFDGW